MTDWRAIELDIARERFADVRTVRKVIRGERVRGHVGERVLAGLRERGLEPQQEAPG